MTPLNQPTWDDVYKTTPAEQLPWYYAELDPDFSRALEAIDGPTKRVLDVGSGPGTQAIALAERGFDVVGVDIAQTAVEYAQIRAREHGVRVDFQVDDILETSLHGPFDYVIDRGVFHTFMPPSRAPYVHTVYQLLRPEGYMLLKCFSHLQPGTDGPFRFSPSQLEEYFSKYFSVISLEDSIFHGSYPHVKALFAILQRR